LLLSSNATGTTAPNSNTSIDPNSTQNNAVSMMGFGAPLQRFGNNRYQQQNQYTPTVITTTSSTISSSPMLISPEIDYDDQLSLVVARLGGWLEMANEREVRDWVVLKNTDLRAGETWLLHVSRAARRVRALV